MLETLAVMIVSGIVGGLLTHVGINLHRKYTGWRHQRDWKLAGRQWKYIVDYYTRTIVPETAADERKRIEVARTFLNGLDLRESSRAAGADKEFFKTLEYLQDESNPNKIPSVSEKEEHDERMVDLERRAERVRRVAKTSAKLA